MLPLISLPDCPHCGQENQGTRAKGGNSVRCAGCGTMRRVPMDRRTWGDDDQWATRPVRGRPLKPGHPYRFQPSTEPRQPRPAPAPRPRQSEPEPAPTPVRRSAPAPASKPATRPVSRPASSSSPTLTTALQALFRPQVTAPTPRQAPRVPRTPAVTVDIPRNPGAPVRKPTIPESQSLRPFVPYRACEHCVIDKIKDDDDTYPAAVIRIKGWRGERVVGTADICVYHLSEFHKMTQTQADFRIAVIERPGPVSEMNRLNCRHGNHAWYQTPGTIDVRCFHCGVKPEPEEVKPTYVNPGTCDHVDAAYDPNADAYRCPRCSHAWPAFG